MGVSWNLKKLQSKRVLDKKLIFGILTTGGVVLLGAYLNVFIAVAAAVCMCCQWYFLIKYHNLVPNIFRDDKRNYQELLIGSEKIPRTAKNDDTLYCLAYKRSLQADICIMERMYSFLSPSGTLRLFYNLDADKVDGIYPVDIYYLHGVTMNELGIRHQKIRYYFPFFMNPFYAIEYFFWDRGGFCFGNQRQIQNDIAKLKEYLEYISEFANQRNIKLVIELQGSQETCRRIKEVISVSCNKKVVFKTKKEEKS